MATRPTPAEAVHLIRTAPAVNLLVACVAFGFSTATGSRLVAADAFPVPVIRAGARIIVPTPALRTALQLDTAPAADAPAADAA